MERRHRYAAADPIGDARAQVLLGQHRVAREHDQVVALGLDTLVDSRIPPIPVEGLRKRLHNVKVVDEGPGLSYFARPSAILIGDENLRAGVDLFRKSTALGY